MRLLLQPEHAGQEDRHFAATAAALRYYGEWYGPIRTATSPSSIRRIRAAPAAWNTRRSSPPARAGWRRDSRTRRKRSPCTKPAISSGTASSATTSSSTRWLDEGLNTFSDERVQSIAFQPNYRVERFFGGFIPWQFRDIALSRETDGNGLNGYRSAAESDDARRRRRSATGPARTRRSPTARRRCGCTRSSDMLGWETLQRILSTYFERWKFRHPRPEDFFAVANEVSGRDLTWFFDQVYRSSNVFDYGVERFVERTPDAVQGLDDGPHEPRFGESRSRRHLSHDGGRAAIRRSDFSRRRRDDVRERRAGRARRGTAAIAGASTPTIARRGRAASAVDPERDAAARRELHEQQPHARAERRTRPRGKWSLKWMVWLQDLLLTWAFFV